MSFSNSLDFSNEPTSPRAPFAQYPATPDAPKSRAPEIYGFVAWSSTYCLFVFYLLWALLPEAWIEWLGVDWYPNREWAILLPAYSVILILLTYFTYWALALHNTPDLADLSTITDSHALVPTHTPKTTNYLLRAARTREIPVPYDLPVGFMSRRLYSRRRE